MTRRDSCVHVGLIIYMLNRRCYILRGVWTIDSDVKTMAKFHDFAGALGDERVSFGVVVTSDGVSRSTRGDRRQKLKS